MTPLHKKVSDLRKIVKNKEFRLENFKISFLIYHILKNIPPCLVWLAAVAEHLPKYHAVAPHVAGVAEGTVVDALGGVP